MEVLFELVGEFVMECLSELLLGWTRNKPTEMPDAEALESYLIRHRPKKPIAVTVILSVLLLGCLVGVILASGGLRLMFGILLGLFVFLLLFPVGSLVYRCRVSQTEILSVCFGIKRRPILWEDIGYVKEVKDDDNRIALISLYRRDGQRLLDIHTSMENAWCLVKTAEKKGIEVRKNQKRSFGQIFRMS